MARIQKPVIWNDKSGAAIDEARLKKHEKSINGMIRKMLPACALFEASMSKFDLRNECRLEVAKALVNFDPITAIEGVTKFSDRKKKNDEEHIQYKRDNSVKVLEELEDLWIRKRLFTYLRRLRWNNSIEEKGGRAVSINAILAKTSTILNFEGEGVSIFGVEEDYNEMNEESSHPDYQHGGHLFTDEEAKFEGSFIDTEKAESDRDELLAILETEGKAGLTSKISQLERQDPERYLNIMSFLDARTRSSKETYNFEEPVVATKSEETSPWYEVSFMDDDSDEF